MEPPHYKRILTLDGGGVRGLALLVVLQELMLRIQVRENLQSPPLPYERFDLIVGTSTGGLVALMLGRLRLSVDQAITAYMELSRRIFEVPQVGNAFRWFNPINANARFSSTALREAMSQIAADEPLADPDLRCRVAVVALRRDDAAAIPELLRTYLTDVTPYECTVVDAALATSAAVTFFDPAEIPIRAGVRQTYIDGGLGYNNPTSLAVEEAERIWGRNCQLHPIVSIGTGTTGEVRLNGNLVQLGRRLVDIATNCDREHHNMLNRFQGQDRGRYFRFSPPIGVAQIGLAEWNRLTEIAASTHGFLQNVAQGDLANLARMLSLDGLPDETLSVLARDAMPVLRTPGVANVVGQALRAVPGSQETWNRTCRTGSWLASSTLLEAVVGLLRQDDLYVHDLEGGNPGMNQLLDAFRGVTPGEDALLNFGLTLDDLGIFISAGEQQIGAFPLPNVPSIRFWLRAYLDYARVLYAVRTHRAAVGGYIALVEANILLLRIARLTLTDEQLTRPIDLMLRLLQASSMHRGMTTESFETTSTTLEGSVYALIQHSASLPFMVFHVLFDGRFGEMGQRDQHIQRLLKYEPRLGADLTVLVRQIRS